MSRTTLSRRLGAASAAAVLALTVAACGGESPSDRQPGSADSGDEPSTDSAADGEDGSASGSDPGRLEELTAEEFYPTVMGALEDAGSARFTITTSTDGGPGVAQAMELVGELAYEDGEPDLRARSTGSDGMRMMLVDGVMYLRGSGLDLGGKQWLKIDPDDPAYEDNIFGMLVNSADPEAMFAAARSPKEFTLLGEEQVGGAPANHYEIVLDAASVADAMEFPAELRAFLPEEIPSEMWVDAQGRPVRFRQVNEAEVPGRPRQVVTTVTDGTYDDFGVDVDIDAPADSRVTTELRLQGMPTG